MTNKNENITERFSDIDVFRGLCMILVILGHAIGTPTDPVNKYILSFHMPIFFFISGICLNLSKNNRNVPQDILHKIKTLGYQYLVFSFLGIAYYWLIRSRFKDLSISFTNSIACVFNGYNIVPGFWFVFDLLVITLIYTLCKKVKKKEWFILPIFLILFVLMYEKNETSIGQINALCRIAVGGVFYSMGVIYGVYYQKTLVSVVRNHNRVCLLIAIIFMTIVYGAEYCNTPVLMGNNDYGNLLQFFCGATLACFGISLFTILIQSNNVLEYIGRNSISFLFVHFYILDYSHVAYNYLFGSGYNQQFPYYILHLCIALGGGFVFSWFVNKYMPYLKKYPF